MTKKLTLPYWADLHAHFRQDDITNILAEEYLKMNCYAVLAMPNTLPPVAKVLESGEGSDLPYWSVEKYKKDIEESFGNKLSEVIVPLYLTKNTTPEMIAEGKKSGLLKAVKYYPPHGTTNSDHSLHMEKLMDSDIIKALEDNDIVLCIHGEESTNEATQYYDKDRNAETEFYRNIMPKLAEKFPKLRIVAEHITTEVAVNFVKSNSSNVVATITPQHLLYTIGDLLLTKSTHLVCMPYVKFEDDRQALRDAVLDPDNSKFFAGTDNAPHPKLSKQTDCGCAAGCYVGGIAPQLYAEAFEIAGCDLFSDAGYSAFKKFLCDIGPDFYNLEKSEKTFDLFKKPQKVSTIKADFGDIIPLPVGLVKEQFRDDVYISWSL
jgi:dihydroorotase